MQLTFLGNRSGYFHGIMEMIIVIGQLISHCCSQNYEFLCRDERDVAVIHVKLSLQAETHVDCSNSMFNSVSLIEVSSVKVKITV